jgi:hypothetical protein
MTQGFGIGKFQPRAPGGPAFGAPAAAPAAFGAPAAAPQAAAPAAFGAPRGPAPAAAPVAAPGQSRWAGLQPARDREPMLDIGKYVVRVLMNELTNNAQTREETFKAHLEIMHAEEGSRSRVGDRVAVICKLVGPAAQRNAERMMSYIMAAAGFGDVAEYDTFDPQRRFIEAVQGVPNEYSAAGATIVGRLVWAYVSRGNDVLDKTTKQPTGDYYRDIIWVPVDESQQDATRKPGT